MLYSSLQAAYEQNKSFSLLILTQLWTTSHMTCCLLIFGPKLNIGFAGNKSSIFEYERHVIIGVLNAILVVRDVSDFGL